MKHSTYLRRIIFACAILSLSFVLFVPAGLCLELRSDAFDDGADVPVRYTGLGENVSPELNWDGVPDGTRSFVLIVEDPDAPLGIWTHWVVYNIPGDVVRLEENIQKIPVLSDGTREGVNSFRQIGYYGPQPPPGPPHRYQFILYALDNIPNIVPGVDRETVMTAIKGHILEKAQITGLFGRK